MVDNYCSDCKKNTEIVVDYSAGDTMCSECGLVLESHSIDEKPEWRIYPDQLGDNDPVRVGHPTYLVLAEGKLSTNISRSNGVTSDFLSSSLGREENRGLNPDQPVFVASNVIAAMSDRYLNLCICVQLCVF